jgi:hypothetical protein
MAGMMMGGAASKEAEADRSRAMMALTLQRIVETSAQVETDDKSPETQALFRKLNERVSMSFANETPLEDVLKYIKAATASKDDPGIPIYVDPAGLRSTGQTMQSTIQMDLEGIPLRTTLRLMLKQLGLAYCVRDGLLIISSVEGVWDELQEYEWRHEAEAAIQEGEPVHKADRVGGGFQ